MKVSQAIKSYQACHRINSQKNALKNYASRAGTPIEIVSKLYFGIPSFDYLTVFLGKISDIEALK
jgi:hypothetical protein